MKISAKICLLAVLSGVFSMGLFGFSTHAVRRSLAHEATANAKAIAAQQQVTEAQSDADRYEYLAEQRVKTAMESKAPSHTRLQGLVNTTSALDDYYVKLTEAEMRVQALQKQRELMLPFMNTDKEYLRLCQLADHSMELVTNQLQVAAIEISICNQLTNKRRCFYEPAYTASLIMAVLCLLLLVLSWVVYKPRI